MPQKAVFFDAGCPVCVSAEQQFAKALDPAQFSVEVVPALVLGDQPFHINFGAALVDLK